MQCRRMATCSVVAGFALLACAGLARAQTPLREATVEQLVERLAPPPAAATRSLRNIVPKAQPLDLSVQFDFDSARLQTASKPLLGNLARALASERLAGARIMVEGHTDAKGTAAYNDALSQRRADAVAAFLVQEGIDRKRIATSGKGFRELLLPDQPEADENRRVRVQLMEAGQ